MKKIILLTILCFSAVGCSVDPPPNPGFRVETYIAVNQGFPGFPVYIPAPKVGTLTSGNTYLYQPGDPPPTGTVAMFPGKVSNSLGYFDVNNGVAPYVWRLSAISGWGLCNGYSNFFHPMPGGIIEPTCYEDGRFFIFPLVPQSIYRDGQPVELQATLYGINTDNGMPIFHFENYAGQLTATTTATQVNGSDVRASSSCLTDKPVGTYTVKVYNAPIPNSPPSEPVGISSISIINYEEVPPCVEEEQICSAQGGIWRGCTRGCYSPIVIDVDGNGYNLTNGRNGVYFDLAGEGFKDKVSWTSANSDDAWLVLDRNGNGKIDNGRELFGNFTAQSPSIPVKDRNGFLALADYDKASEGGNNDGDINQSDNIFNALRLWQDKNHNGISEQSELSTLPQLDIERIELEYKISKQTDEHGNRFKYRAKVQDAGNARVGRWAWDVFLVRPQ